MNQFKYSGIKKNFFFQNEKTHPPKTNSIQIENSSSDKKSLSDPNLFFFRNNSEKVEVISHSNNNITQSKDKLERNLIKSLVPLLKPIRNSCPDVGSSQKNTSDDFFKFQKQSTIPNLNIFNFSFQKKDNELNFSFNQCDENTQRKSLYYIQSIIYRKSFFDK